MNHKTFTFLPFITKISTLFLFTQSMCHFVIAGKSVLLFSKMSIWKNKGSFFKLPFRSLIKPYLRRVLNVQALDSGLSWRSCYCRRKSPNKILECTMQRISDTFPSYPAGRKGVPTFCVEILKVKIQPNLWVLQRYQLLKLLLILKAEFWPTEFPAKRIAESREISLECVRSIFHEQFGMRKLSDKRMPTRNDIELKPLSWICRFSAN